MSPRSLVPLVVACALAAACGEDVNLPPAVFPNEVDTVVLYALSGTPVNTQSGYQLEFERPVRTDQTSDFDFAFDLTPGGPRFIPTGPLGLQEGSGFQPAFEPFDSILVAPVDGYATDSAVSAGTGLTYLIRSRPASCTFGTFAYFARLQVVAVDTTARTVRFAILVNTNCGYRSLEPGIPDR